MKIAAVAVTTLTFLLAGCGMFAVEPVVTPGGGDTGVSDPEEPVTMTPVPGSDVHDVDGQPERVRPRPGMADVRAVAWEKARPTRAGSSVRVVYWSGVEPCNVLDHVDVKYAKTRIVVTLYEGHDPEAGDVACIEIAVQKVVVVPLDEPIAGREVVDGTRT